MFKKQMQSTNRKNSPAPGQTPITPLELFATDSDALYRFPPELVQALRHMVTKLNRAQKLPPKIAVVSALRQEGVSFVTQALAAVMAHDLSRRVCLVDLNWWWPSTAMHELANHRHGLLPLLHGEVSLENAVVQTNHPHLSILPAGALPAGQRPVIARGDALQTVIATLSRQVDHIILDVPAILTTSDAIPLASLGDACCVVVQQGISSRATVKRALAEIDHLPMLGVIMNRVQVATPASLLKWIPQA
jgi:Mrp family chromosome partitioning ATPase